MVSTNRVKYGQRGGWFTKMVGSSYDIGVWKVIRNEWNMVIGNLAFEVGDGRRVNFWNDKWCRLRPLCDVSYYFCSIFPERSHD